MKKKSKRTLTPKLRFPEFRGEGEWEEKSVNAISDVNPNHEGLPDSFVYIDLESVEQGKFVAEKVINRDGAPSRAQRLLRKRDVIYQTVRPYQRNNLFFDVEDEREYVASTGYAQLRAHASPAFLFQLLHTNDFVNRVLAKCTGSNYPAINSSDLAAIEVAVPPPAEQQKIAECLSSLDGLIAAEGRALEALKAHKKGLMRQLFPQPGQTQPRLRFPEFRDKGEWDVRPLGDICERIMDGTHFSPQTKDGPRLYLTSKNIRNGAMDLSSATFISEEEHRDIYKRCPVRIHDVLLTKDGASTGNCTINTLDYEFSLLSSVAVIRGNSELLDQQFLYQNIASDRTQQLITGSMSGQAITRITLAKLGEYPIAYPSKEEQHRIADCLSSLDARIAAQAAKIESLKTHKRGLMQQLFPSPEVS